MSRLTVDAMREIAGKVFGERSMTLSQAGAAYELDEMASVVTACRRMMASTLETLPDAAFDQQPHAEGEAAWSAGQVIAHLANSQAAMSSPVRSLLGMSAAGNTDRIDMETLPSREEAVAILAKATAEFDAFVAEIPENADLDVTSHHDRFGEMSGKGWMLLMALHEGDHLRQVRAMAD